MMGPFGKIFLAVFALHMALLVPLSIDSSAKSVPVQKKKSVVAKTVELKPKVVAKAQPQPQPKAQAKAKPKSQPKAKVVDPAPVVAKAPTKTPAKTPSKTVAAAKPQKKSKTKPSTETAEAPAPSKKKQELIAKAQSRLSKVGKQSASDDSAPTLEVAVPSLDRGLSSQESTYYDTIVQQLQTMLHLPEYGEVEVRLTLNRNGTVALVEVLSTKSLRNKEAVKAKLSTLHFSPFTTAFTSAPTHTFHLTLKNS